VTNTFQIDQVMEADPGGIEADPGSSTVLAVTQKEWMNTTVTALGHTKDRANQVRFALRALEQKEADRTAAQRAERKRQELQAEAAEKKRIQAVMAERERRFRELQAEELRLKQGGLRAGKKAEMAALAAATANFNKLKQVEREAKEKEAVMGLLKHTSQQVLEGVLECQHSISMLWGSLILCEKRNKLREERPETEMFKDNVDQALERELKTLLGAREHLNGLVKRGETLRTQMEALREQLNGEKSRETIMQRLTKSNSTPAVLSNSSPAVMSCDQRPQPTPTKDVLKKAVAVIDEAAELPKQSFVIRSQVHSNCELAATDVHTHLDRRKAELGDLIKGLADEKADAEKTIGEAERRIVGLRRRAQNTMETPRSSKATDDQVSSAESMVVELKSLKDTLEADLCKKMQALKIDQSCRQLTKITSGVHVSKVASMRKTAKDGGFMQKTVKGGSSMQRAG